MNIPKEAKIVGIILGILWGLFAGLIILANYSSGMQCNASWSEKYIPRYDWLSGCTIIVNGERIPSANYRVL